MRIHTPTPRWAALLALGLAWAAPAHAWTQGGTAYSGRAYAASVNLPTLAVGPQFFADTGQLPPDGGHLSATFLSAEIPAILTAQVLVADTNGANGLANSSASLAELTLLPNNPAQVKATFVRAESQATCNGVSGTTEIADLSFGGANVVVTGAANQMVTIPGVATLFINEQIKSSGGGLQDITVNALHLILLTNDEVVLSSAHSDISGCPGCPPVPSCHDFVTGGGWINAGTSRANFGFNAGYKPGSTSPEVEFNYIDHNTGMHVKATSITQYVVGPTPTSRHFEGLADIDGTPGHSYAVDVADNGEPGRMTDTLSITLDGGNYSNGGALQGGNIQLHKPCP
jgi:hypothetical protein